MPSLKTVRSTYRLTAESTAQAIKVAEAYRKEGWKCATRGRRLVMTTLQEVYLHKDTQVTVWQVDRSPHEEACREWLVPELRGSRKKGPGQGPGPAG